MVRIRKALCILSMLMESCFRSLFFYFGFQIASIIVEEKKSAALGSYVLILDSFMLST